MKKQTRILSISFCIILLSCLLCSLSIKTEICRAGWADGIKSKLFPPAPPLSDDDDDDFYKEDISGDFSFTWDDNHEWDSWKNRGNYRFYTLDGEIYCIRGQYAHGLDLFKYDRENSEIHFQRQIFDDDYSLTGPEFDPLLFAYQGHYYAIHYYESFVPQYQDTPKYEGRRFLLAYADGLKKDDKWHWTDNMPVDGRHHEFKIYRGAAADNDYLYLVYDSYVKDDDIHYHEEDIYIDKAVIDAEHRLKILHTYKLHDVMARESHHPYAVTSFTHPDGNTRLLISYSGENNDDKENKGGGVLIFDPVRDHHKHLYTSEKFAFSIRAIHGTIKGDRHSPSGSRKDGNRIQVFYNHCTPSHWDGIHHIDDRGTFYYRTYRIERDDDDDDDDKDEIDYDYEPVAKGEIRLGNEDYHPDNWDRMNLDVASLLKPVKLDDDDPAGYNFKQRIWMFYTDKDGIIRGKGFISDIWHFIPQHQADGRMASYVESSDLWDTDTYGDEIKKTWILYGIIEGAPPCSIDWDKWDDNHSSDKPPSSITYVEEHEKKCQVSLSAEASWYWQIGAEGEIAGGETKFSKKLSQEVENSISTTVGSDLTFDLNKDMQILGAKLYIIPKVKRITYALFPWWEEDFSREHSADQIFSYRFLASASRSHTEYLPLTDPLFGFTDAEHQKSFDSGRFNDPSLAVWMIDDYASGGRRNLQNNQDKAITLPLEWHCPGTGDQAWFEEVREKSVTTSQENEFEVSEEVDLPSVFSISGGISFSWGLKSQVTTQLSRKLELSYEYLIEDNDGPDISGLELTAYWFYEADKIKDLWYIDYLEKGEHPWYIGYVVEDIYDKCGPDNGGGS